MADTLDVFGRPAQKAQGAFSADSASLSFSNSDGIASIASLLVQSLNAQYAQAITRVFELSSAAVTFIQGRSTGSISIGRIIGPAKTGSDFISKFSSVCNLEKNNVIFNLKAAKQDASCQDGSTEGFKAVGCVVESVSYSVSSQQLVIQQTVSMQVVSLNKTDKA